MPFLVFGGFVLLLALLSFDDSKSDVKKAISKSVVKAKFDIGDTVSVKGKATGDTFTYKVNSKEFDGSEWVYALNDGNKYQQSKLAFVS